jgi:DsbC/DsbD-like thiol-disulfide interchange protein
MTDRSSPEQKSTLPGVHRVWLWAVSLVFAAVISGEAIAQFSPGPPGQRQAQLTADQLVDVRVMLDRAEVGPGETFHVIAVFDIDRPWHLYWKNPGEAGALPPSVNVTVPDGFEVGEMRWPRPKRLNSPAGEMFCYENQLALFVPVTAPAELEDGEVTIETSFRYAVCDADRCLFGTGSQKPRLRTTSTVGSEATSLSERNARVLERHLPRLPRTLTESDQTEIALDETTLSITVPAHGYGRATFFPYDVAGVEFGKPEMTFEDDRLTVTVPLSINPNNFRSGTPTAGGLIALGQEPDGPSYEGAVPIDRD